MSLLKKITVKDVCGRTKAPSVPSDAAKGTKAKDMLLMTVMGLVTRVSHGEGNYGLWTKLHGQFEAVRIEDGEIFTAGACILPDVVNDMIAAQMSQADINTLEFAVDVGVREHDSPIGYEYYAEPLISMEESNPLNGIREKIKDRLPPPADEKPDEKPEEKKKK